MQIGKWEEEESISSWCQSEEKWEMAIEGDEAGQMSLRLMQTAFRLTGRKGERVCVCLCMCMRMCVSSE